MKALQLTILLSLTISLLSFGQTWEKLNQQVAEYCNAGDYENGIITGEECLDAAEKEFGKNHENYISSLRNLGYLYKSVGRYAEAEPFYVQTMKILKEVLGEHHLDYATSINNLGFLYKSMGRYAEAETLYVQAMNISCYR